MAGSHSGTCRFCFIECTTVDELRKDIGMGSWVHFISCPKYQRFAQYQKKGNKRKVS